MKACAKKLFILPFLLAVPGSLLIDEVTAQTFTVLHSFTATSTNASGIYTNSEGFNPFGGLVLSGNTLYGTAAAGGSAGYGTVFSLSINGTGFKNLHNFIGGSDGSTPQGRLVLSGNTLYGTAAGGGSVGAGTVFSVNTNGTDFITLHSFSAGDNNSSGFYTNSDGLFPYDVILSGTTLYGTTMNGGSAGYGTVFSLSINGTGFTNLHNFIGNSDGFSPLGGLVLSGNTLYGTARPGTVFSVAINGTGFTTLHSFTGSSDEGDPSGRLVLSGNTLYGAAQNGGYSTFGTVFRLNTDGTGFTNLHSFSFYSDGAFPYGELVLSGNTLYGTAQQGGAFNKGTLFAVTTNGTGFKNLYNFTGGSDGLNPYGGMLLSGNTLYGIAYGGGGGSAGGGTVFSLSFTPKLTIVPSGMNVILSWPTNFVGFDYTGFTLQSTTNLNSPVWGTDLPVTVVVNGRSTVTNPVSGAKQFFRLSQ